MARLKLPRKEFGGRPVTMSIVASVSHKTNSSVVKVA